MKIYLSGRTLKNNIGINSVDITLKLVDDEENLITLDQIHTRTDGKAYLYISGSGRNSRRSI